MKYEEIFAHHKCPFKNAVKGEVVTRFPPEPSGFLHVGHAKAAIINFYYAKMFDGKMILRFDDTNPSKEKEDFVSNIMKDVETLGLKPDSVSYTSNYFPKLMEIMEKLIAEGHAYADDLDKDVMKVQRGQGIESPNRNNSPAESLKHWEDIKAGKPEGLKWCIRIKIDMKHPNKCMRDPVFFRCNLTPHHRTGTTYKAYPTYDFAIAVVDSLEGVTHAMRTIEYRERNELYKW